MLFLSYEPSLSSYQKHFNVISLCNMAVFTLEYLARLYAVGALKVSRIKYALRPLMILDLLVLLPFYLSWFGFDMGFLRSLRFLRLFKLFRLAKFSAFDRLMIQVLKERQHELGYILIVLGVLLLTITPVVYFFEHPAQPEVFASMTQTLWWAVVTFTTVGYGDMYPLTTGGRVATAMLSFLGIAFYAVPGSIFTSALLEKINQKSKNEKD